MIVEIVESLLLVIIVVNQPKVTYKGLSLSHMAVLKRDHKARVAC